MRRCSRPSRRIDYELELGFFVGPPNAPGMPLDMAQAEASLFGATLLNDWSARDVQAWEYQPLGPFLAKNFATTISPWIVTMEALAPFRAPFARDPADPQPLPYLDSATNRERGAIAIGLEVWIQTSEMRAPGPVGRARVGQLVRRCLLDARATAGPPRQQRLQPAARRPDGQRHAERPEPGRRAARCWS